MTTFTTTSYTWYDQTNSFDATALTLNFEQASTENNTSQ